MKKVVAGVEVEVVSDAEADEADFSICERYHKGMPLLFDDDLFGDCTICGHRIHYRWHMPRKPKRICLQCAFVKMQKERNAAKHNQ